MAKRKRSKRRYGRRGLSGCGSCGVAGLGSMGSYGGTRIPWRFVGGAALAILFYRAMTKGDAGVSGLGSFFSKLKGAVKMSLSPAAATASIASKVAPRLGPAARRMIVPTMRVPRFGRR